MKKLILLSILALACTESEEHRKERLEKDKTVIYIENVYYLNDTTK